jgi:hypothetical protein
MWFGLAIVSALASCGRVGFDPAVEDNADIDSDGASEPCAPTWTWSGDEVASWTISHIDVAGASNDVCGCATIPTFCICGSPSACVDNTVKSTTNGIGRFDSGPVTSAGRCHRYDGFTARRLGVSVRPGLVHRVRIHVAGLSAAIDGLVGNETTGYRPNWSLAVRAGSATLALLGPIYWATPQCRACATQPSDLGSKELTFTPSSTEVELVLSARHQSSQCCAEAHDVRVEIDHIEVVADTIGCSGR